MSTMSSVRARRGSAGVALALALVATAGAAAGCGGDDGGGGSGGGESEGAQVAADAGCQACHGKNGKGGVAPAWVGLAGSTVELEDGTEVVADADYIRRSIVEPEAQVVEGYSLQMPKVELTDDEVDALVEHIESLG